MYLGTFPAVIIYDFETAKDLFNRDALSGRPDNFPYRFRMLGKRLGWILYNLNLINVKYYLNCELKIKHRKYNGFHFINLQNWKFLISL
jgi:hypothetical protein